MPSIYDRRNAMARISGSQSTKGFAGKSPSAAETRASFCAATRQQKAIHPLGSAKAPAKPRPRG